MTSVAAFYDVWDDSTGNRLGEFETLAEARALLVSILREHGAAAASTLAVLAYTPEESQSGGYQVTTVLEGSDAVGKGTDLASRSPS